MLLLPYVWAAYKIGDRQCFGVSAYLRYEGWADGVWVPLIQCLIYMVCGSLEGSARVMAADPKHIYIDATWPAGGYGLSTLKIHMFNNTQRRVGAIRPVGSYGLSTL